MIPMSTLEKRLAASAAPPPLRAPACSAASHACSARAVPRALHAPNASARHASHASACPCRDTAHSATDRTHDHLPRHPPHIRHILFRSLYTICQFTYIYMATQGNGTEVRTGFRWSSKVMRPRHWDPDRWRVGRVIVLPSRAHGWSRIRETINFLVIILYSRTHLAWFSSVAGSTTGFE